jgi:putative ABC transport system permease protein
MIVAALAVCVASLVAIVTIMLALQKSIESKLETFGFTVIVQPASANLSLSYGGMAISGVDTYEVQSLSEQDMSRIKHMPGASRLVAVSPALLQVVTVGKEQALLVGTDFAQEFRAKKWWMLDGRRPSAPGDIIIGTEAAKTLRLKKGSAVEIAGTRFTVTGILHDTGSQDDSFIFADLRQAQTLFNRGHALSLIEVSTRSSQDTNQVVADIERAVPHASVSSIKQAVQYKERTAGSLANFGLAVTAIVILTSGCIVFTTMMSAVSDRKREIGIFRAIGYRQATIVKIVLLETAILSLLGGFLGYVIGFSSVYGLPVIYKQLTLSVNLNGLVFAGALVLAVFVGIISSIIPVYRAARMDPAEALKSI